jgi:hypothetical protein
MMVDKIHPGFDQSSENAVQNALTRTFGWHRRTFGVGQEVTRKIEVIGLSLGYHPAT